MEVREAPLRQSNHGFVDGEGKHTRYPMLYQKCKNQPQQQQEVQAMTIHESGSFHARGTWRSAGASQEHGANDILNFTGLHFTAGIPKMTLKNSCKCRVKSGKKPNPNRCLCEDFKCLSSREHQVHKPVSVKA